MFDDDGRATIGIVRDRILIVDDHAPFRSAARALLTEEGFQIVGEAADGRAALDAARLLRPDIVLLDINLPDLDGFEVARRLAEAAEDDGDSPAIVLISSRAASAARIARSAARGFIPKDELCGSAVARLVG
ncbi:response regulator transcription factor [Nonomuraea sp. NBC_00507]|uniref:response regulator n=1 Tax=Nonomuraea sp. NBC_00507 TaxID=2976002 RepID=UPI002E18A314